MFNKIQFEVNHRLFDRVRIDLNVESGDVTVYDKKAIVAYERGAWNVHLHSEMLLARFKELRNKQVDDLVSYHGNATFSVNGEEATPEDWAEYADMLTQDIQLEPSE